MPTVKRSYFRAIWDFMTKENCPSCGLSGGVARNRTKEQDRKVPEMTERETTQYDAKGHVTGKTKKQVQVQVLMATFDQHYQCYLCQHDWTERRSEKIKPV